MFFFVFDFILFFFFYFFFQAEDGIRDWSVTVVQTCALPISMIVHPASDEHAEKKAGVDDGHEFVEANEDVANEEGQRRKGKREATVAEEGSGKESHRADRCEIPRMWCDAESGGDDNYGEGEQQAIKQSFFWRDFGVHISTPCAPVKPASCSECKSDTKVV